MVIWFISCILIHTLLVYATCRCDHQNQKQTSRGAFKKRCSENIQQIYKRTPMSKLLCNFTEITLRLGCSPLNLLYIFRTPPRKKTSGVLPLDIIKTYENHRSAQRIKVSNQLIRKGTIPATVLADIVLT